MEKYLAVVIFYHIYKWNVAIVRLLHYLPRGWSSLTESAIFDQAYIVLVTVLQAYMQLSWSHLGTATIADTHWLLSDIKLIASRMLPHWEIKIGIFT